MLLDLPAEEWNAYKSTITGVSTKRLMLSLMDRAGNPIENLSGAFIDGSVTIDATTDVSRSAELQILDPFHRYGFDADTYQGGDLDLTRQIRGWWITDSELLSRPVQQPVFYGPITRLGRDGPIVNIEVQDPAVYGLQPAKRTLVIKKGARRTHAIKVILRERMGITRLAIPDLPGRLAADLVIHPKDLPWKEAQKLADSLNRHLYFDANGFGRLRAFPDSVAWRFRSGIRGGSLTSHLATESDLTQVINRVVVKGRTPKGKKDPISYVAVADESHPLSAQKLGPPGAPMWRTEERQNDHFRTVRECREYAERRLARGLRLGRQVQFTAAPVPHLEPEDIIAATTDFEEVETRLDTATLPLGPGGDMQVGYTGPYRLHRQKRRRAA
jgi:hypothetical protein